MSPEVLAELEGLAWVLWRDTRSARAYEAWQRLWFMRGVVAPEGAWECP